MFPLIIGPELQLIREEFTWAQTLWYQHSDTAIWLTLERASSLSALCDYLCCKWKVGPDTVRWEGSGEWDTHSSQVPVRRNGSVCLGDKTPSLPSIRVNGEVIRTDLGITLGDTDHGIRAGAGRWGRGHGHKELHSGFRNLWGQQASPGFTGFDQRICKIQVERSRFLVLKKIIKIQSGSFG